MLDAWTRRAWAQEVADRIDPQSPPDPFGDAVRDAQEPRSDPDPTYAPDDFTAPGFDTDAAYRRAMGGGS